MAEKNFYDATVLHGEEAKQCTSWNLPEVTGQRLSGLAQKSTKPQDLDKEKHERQKLYENKLKKGYEDGLKKGEVEGLKKAEQTYREKISEVCQVLNTVNQGLVEFSSTFEEQIASVVEYLVKAIIEVELVTNKEIIVEVVKKSLECLPSGIQDVKLRINPEEIDVVNRVLNEAKNQISYEIKVIEDPTLKPGGCLIDSDMTSLDAKIDEKISDVLRKVSQINALGED